jgi:hypothetical protein
MRIEDFDLKPTVKYPMPLNFQFAEFDSIRFDSIRFTFFETRFAASRLTIICKYPQCEEIFGWPRFYHCKQSCLRASRSEQQSWILFLRLHLSNSWHSEKIIPFSSWDRNGHDRNRNRNRNRNRSRSILKSYASDMVTWNQYRFSTESHILLQMHPIETQKPQIMQDLNKSQEAFNWPIISCHISLFPNIPVDKWLSLSQL